MKLIQQKEIALGTRLFEFEKPRKFVYKAGQYADLTLPSPKFSDASGATRTFSFVSAPYEKTLVFATRMRDSTFKRSMAKLKAGDRIKLVGPGGSFGHSVSADGVHLQEGLSVFIAGGIGITPFISILRDSFGKNEERPIFLFYSNSGKGETVFLEELEGYASRRENFIFVGAVTEINAKLIQKHLGNFSNATFYIAGSVAFVNYARQTVLSLGASDDDIHTDEFAGY